MINSSYLLVGLGNPGSEYENTRHNIGFMAVDHFAAACGIAVSQSKWQGRYGRGRWRGKRLCLLKPETYMNKSGECVARFGNFFRIAADHLLVIHDDLDLPLGRVKITARGGAGGHNGIRSLISHLGRSDFIRIKIGIGRPPRVDNRPVPPVEKYVLTGFPPDEKQVVAETLPLVDEAVELILTDGVSAAMNVVNRKDGKRRAAATREGVAGKRH